MAPHSSTLAWKIPWTEEPGGLQSMGLLRVRRDWVTSLSLFTFHFHALEKEIATYLLQCSCLENPRDSGAWWAAIYGSHRVGHDWGDLAAAARGPSVSYLRQLLGWAETDFLHWALPRKFLSRENVFNQQQQQQQKNVITISHSVLDTHI